MLAMSVVIGRSYTPLYSYIHMDGYMIVVQMLAQSISICAWFHYCFTILIGIIPCKLSQLGLRNIAIGIIHFILCCTYRLERNFVSLKVAL